MISCDVIKGVGKRKIDRSSSSDLSLTTAFYRQKKRKKERKNVFTCIGKDKKPFFLLLKSTQLKIIFIKKN